MIFLLGSKNNFLFEISGVPEQKVADKTAGAFNHPTTVSPLFSPKLTIFNYQ